jgi:hypothetical protein
MSEDISALLLVGVLSLILGLVGNADYEDALDEEALYCQQTQLFQRTGGQSGWPDYKDIREEACE